MKDIVIISIVGILIIIQLIRLLYIIKQRQKELDRQEELHSGPFLDFEKPISLKQWDMLLKTNQYDELVQSTGFRIFQRQTLMQVEYDEQELLDFLREWKDRLNWMNICIYVQLPEKVLEEFTDRLIWEAVAQYQHYSTEFKERYKENLVIKYYGYKNIN